MNPFDEAARCVGTIEVQGGAGEQQIVGVRVALPSQSKVKEVVTKLDAPRGEVQLAFNGTCVWQGKDGPIRGVEKDDGGFE